MIQILSFRGHQKLKEYGIIQRKMTVDDHIGDILGIESDHSVDHVADDILSGDDLGTGLEIGQFEFDHHGHEEDATRHLPILNGWLKLQGAKKAKHWVVIIGSHLLWSARKETIQDDTLYKQ